MQRCSQSKRSLYYLLSIIVMVIFLTLTCGCSVRIANTPQPTTGFETLIGAPINPMVELHANQKEYVKDGDISVYVINRTNQPIFYPDQAYGIKGYRYNTETSSWEAADLQFQVLSPHPIVVPPNDFQKDFALFNGFPVPAKLAPGGLRLVVVGWTDTNNPEGSKVAAYTDITIK